MSRFDRAGSRRDRGSLARSPALASLVVLFTLTACRSPLDMGPVSFDRQSLQSAEEVDLSRLSRTPPVGVEEATAEVLREVIDPASAPSEVPIDLAQVRAAALRGNLELRAELFNPTIAQTVVDEEEAKFEWTFFATAARTRIDRPTPTLLEAAQSDLNAFNLGVDIPLRTGGSVIVDVPFQDLETSDPFAILNPSYDAAARFSISQPLLRNAGVRVNTNSIRVAGYQSQIVDARTKLSAIRILAAADKAYWNLYAAKRELVVTQQRYELAVEQLDRARRLVAAGNAAEVEIIRSQAGVADSLTGIIVAETAIRVRQRELKRIMNREDLPMNGPTAIIPATDPSPVGLDLDAEQLAGRAVQNRMEMLELELQLAIDASNLDFQRNQALPLFVVEYTYSRAGLGDGYRPAFSQVTDRSFEDWRLAARIEIPLGNEAAKARVHRAILERVQRLATRDQRRQAIREEVFNALDLLQESWQRILAARQQTILAARTFDAERRQFELGLRTSTDVLDAAARLADAQTQEVRSLAEYQIAQVDIAFATGTLLGNGRVQWTPSQAP